MTASVVLRGRLFTRCGTRASSAFARAPLLPRWGRCQLFASRRWRQLRLAKRIMTRAAAARLGASWTFGPLHGSPKPPGQADDFEEFAETLPKIEDAGVEEFHQDTDMLDRLLSNIIEQPQPTSSPSSESRRVLGRASSSISALLDSSRLPHSRLSTHGSQYRPPRSPRSAPSTRAAPAGNTELLNRAMTFVLEGTKVRMFPTGDSGDSGDSGCEILGVRQTGKRPTPNPVRIARCLSHSPVALVTLAHLPRGQPAWLAHVAACSARRLFRSARAAPARARGQRPRRPPIQLAAHLPGVSTLPRRGCRGVATAAEDKKARSRPAAPAAALSTAAQPRSRGS